MEINAPVLIKPRDLAVMLHLSEGTLANMRSGGGGPKFIKIGQSVMYSMARVQEWIDSNTYEITTDESRKLRCTKRAEIKAKLSPPRFRDEIRKEVEEWTPTRRE